jgi:hypothetical protein
MAVLFLGNNPADERCPGKKLNEASMKAKGDKPANTSSERAMAGGERKTKQLNKI